MILLYKQGLRQPQISIVSIVFFPSKDEEQSNVYFRKNLSHNVIGGSKSKSYKMLAVEIIYNDLKGCQVFRKNEGGEGQNRFSST